MAKKEKNCDPTDPADDRKGDTWDHVAIDAESRLVLSVVAGERTDEEEAILNAYGETITPARPASEGVPRPRTRSRRRG